MSLTKEDFFIKIKYLEIKTAAGSRSHLEQNP